MTRTTDAVALNDWYAVATAAELGATPQCTQLLGEEITLQREAGIATPRDSTGAALPAREAYGLLFTTLGQPRRDIVHIAEAAETDRRVVPCGWTTIHASGLRIVENFLDMAHFPYVHHGILGAEPHTEVMHYPSGIDREADEVWATGCRFWQPRAAATDTTGTMMEIDYRVPSPFVVMLYRFAPSQPHRRDCIALFIQPMQAALCRALPIMWLVDEISTHSAMLHFEQTIFLQDRIIVENQRPLTLPLEPRAEIPTRADASSVVYRRWLKEKGLRFGTTEGGA
ncbi:MAG: aromatic ring-hydroxylating dioxygenase subunit alpha [Alphaproteobacteria bacterium]|nr:aromatic ring-hydroxylating dioxygenase subunit alpha [Alphaproteobacteria bacterium]